MGWPDFSPTLKTSAFSLWRTEFPIRIALALSAIHFSLALSLNFSVQNITKEPLQTSDIISSRKHRTQYRAIESRIPNQAVFQTKKSINKNATYSTNKSTWKTKKKIYNFLFFLPVRSVQFILNRPIRIFFFSSSLSTFNWHTERRSASSCWGVGVYVRLNFN